MAASNGGAEWLTGYQANFHLPLYKSPDGRQKDFSLSDGQFGGKPMNFF